MLTFSVLTHLTPADLRRVASGYTADEKYEVTLVEGANDWSFKLRLVKLAHPFLKSYEHFPEETLKQYTQVLAASYSFGAYADDLLVGVLVAEPMAWNRSLWVHEFHVADTHRRRGIGRQLMERVTEQARATGLRIIVCETQNINPAAIAAYRRLGFRPEGVDISYYSNEDYPHGEVAIFMK